MVARNCQRSPETHNTTIPPKDTTQQLSRNPFLGRIIIGSDRRPQTKQGIEGKIDRFRSGRVRVRVRVRDRVRSKIIIY